MGNKFLEKSDPSKKNRFNVWLSQAKYDLQAAEHSLESRDYEWVCYQSIQSVEKALKAVVVHAGYRPPRTHKLGVLISMANQANDLFKNVKLKAFRKIESYTFISRYPFVTPKYNQTPHELVKKEDAETCIRIAKELMVSINHFIETSTPKETNIVFDELYYTNAEIDKRIEDIKDCVLKCTDLQVEKIILFGSFAREKTRPRLSTMDIIVIAETDKPFIERIEYVREVTKGGYPIIEPLVYTREEFDTLVNEEGEGFLESALEEGEVIYDVNSTDK